jgi:cysteine-rich repeat protein
MPTSNGLYNLSLSALLLLFQAGCTLEVYDQSMLDPKACGNSRIDPGEVCDDGNTQDGDGCSHDCKSIETCGNGLIDVQAQVPETCDDGPNNGALGDPCSATCQTVTGVAITGFADPNYLISGAPVTSTAHVVLRMTFEDRTPGTNVSLCAGPIEEFAQGTCSMQLSGSGGPGFVFLTIIDASVLSGDVLYAVRQIGTVPAQFVLTIE